MSIDKLLEANKKLKETMKKTLKLEKPKTSQFKGQTRLGTKTTGLKPLRELGR